MMGDEVEYMYLGEVDETLACMVCHEPLVDPVVEPNCRVTFCRRCVSPWVAEKHSCPSCRGPASVAQLHPAPRIIIQLLDALPVACPTCNGRHQRGNLARHIQLCPKPCARGCGEAVAQAHVKAHEDTCASVTAACPAADVGCAVVLPRAQLVAHVPTCPLAPLRPLLLRMQALEAEVAQLRPFRLRTQALEAEVAQIKRALRPRGRFVRAWGARGSADAQFSAPCGLTIAQDQGGGGLVIVADHNNHRVQVFDAEGRLRAKFGGEGSALGRFYHPRGVATLALGGRIVVLVADRDNHRVQVFDDQGRVQSAFGTQGRRHGQLEQPWGVAVDPQRGHAVFVSDSGNHRVQAFDLQGNHLHSFGAQGDQPGQLQQPCGIAVDRRRGLVWVADTDNHRVQVFDRQGRFLRGFGGRGAGEGRFQFPRDIVVVDGDDDDDDEDSATRVYVTDNHRVQMFDGHGWFLGAIGREGQAEGCFDHPRGVAVDSQGRVFVADSANHRVQVFTFAGK